MVSLIKVLLYFTSIVTTVIGHRLTITTAIGHRLTGSGNGLNISVCEYDPDTGFCRGAFPRWYYNRTTGKCEVFTYGGCRGNHNNFKNYDTCKKKCMTNFGNHVIIVKHSQMDKIPLNAILHNPANNTLLMRMNYPANYKHHEKNPRNDFFYKNVTLIQLKPVVHHAYHKRNSGFSCTKNPIIIGILIINALIYYLM